MDLDNNHALKIVIIEDNHGIPGDVYDDFRRFKKEHPYSGYRFGFCIATKSENCIPENCNDWNDSPEEALHDYFDNVIGRDAVHAAEECAKTLNKTIIELERYRQFEEIFRSKMTDAACDLLKDKKEFAKWLDRNKEIAEKYDKYAEAEKQEKLLKLPCAFGDTVYVKMQSGGYAEGKVRDFAYFHTCGFCVVITSEYFDKQSIPFSEFGKTVFLTKP